MPGRGGRRSGAGRKAITQEERQTRGSVAVEVLGRLAELNLKGVQSEADLILYLMREHPKALVGITLDMLNRAHGKPAQAVIAEGKLTIEVKELGSGNSPSAETGTTAAIM